MKFLTKYIFVFALCFLFQKSYGQTIFTENFDYSAGDSIGAHGWTGFSSFVNVIKVTSPGLTFTGYTQSGIGNACRLSNNGQDAYKDFPADSTNTLYVSYMIRVDSVKSGGDYFAALLPPTSTTLYTARMYAKDTLGGVAFGLSKSTAGNGGIFWTSTPYLLGTTYLVILKYQFNTGSTTDDQMSLFIFATPPTPVEPVVAQIGPITGTSNDNTLGRIGLRQGSAASSPTVTIDGFKVAQTYNNIIAGISSQVSSIPEGFNLAQNYPNPFNPTTNIKFSIPSTGFVSLKVYNALGQEINSLVNNQLSAGVYEIPFNGSSFNSGVYFYRLQFNSLSGENLLDTKKFILSK